MELELQPAPSGTEKKNRTVDVVSDGGMAGPVATLDRLIAVTRNAERTFLVLAIAVLFVAAGLLLGLYLTQQLRVAGAIGSAATAMVAAVPVALMVSERARFGALQSAKSSALRVSSDPARQKETADAINVLIAILT